MDQLLALLSLKRIKIKTEKNTDTRGVSNISVKGTLLHK